MDPIRIRRSASKKSWSARALLARLQDMCRRYRQTLLVRAIAQPAEIEAAWPGGAENDDPTLWGWVKCYGTLRTFLARREQRTRPGATVEQRQALLDAMADRPEIVTLLARDADGAPRQVTVYPKGNVALTEVHNRNRELARIIDDAEVIRTSQSAHDIELHARALDEQSYLQRLLCWIATTPGARLPFPEGTARPELPVELADLTALDYYTICEAFSRVNVMRLMALQDATKSSKAPDWSIFFATVATELHVPAQQLMRDWSLASVLAQAAERARAQEEARQRAEAERATHRSA